MLITGFPTAGWNLSRSFSNAKTAFEAFAIALIPVTRAAAVWDARPNTVTSNATSPRSAFRTLRSLFSPIRQ